MMNPFMKWELETSNEVRWRLKKNKKSSAGRDDWRAMWNMIEVDEGKEAKEPA